MIQEKKLGLNHVLYTDYRKSRGIFLKWLENYNSTRILLDSECVSYTIIIIRLILFYDFFLNPTHNFILIKVFWAPHLDYKESSLL